MLFTNEDHLHITNIYKAFIQVKGEMLCANMDHIFDSTSQYLCNKE